MKEGLNARKITMKKSNRISQTNKKENSTIKCGFYQRNNSIYKRNN